MVLRNKDGTPYRTFSEPNPLTKDMEQWSPKDEDVVLHNVGDTREETLFPNAQTAQTFKPEPKPEPEPPKHEPEPPKPEPEPPKPEPEPPKPEPEPPKPEPEPPKPEQRHVEPNPDHVVRSWCLPVASANGHGQVWGTRFWFDCVLVEYLPYQMMFWTTSDAVTIGSIVFPSKYVKSQNRVEMYRWWKVVAEMPCEDGRLFRTVPSTESPDFSA